MKRKIIKNILWIVIFALFFAWGGFAVRHGDAAKTAELETLKAPSRGSIGGFDLNTATKEMFMEIHGIGEVYSQNIIEQREEMGGFRYVDDLLYVKGIGMKRLEKIKPYVRVR